MPKLRATVACEKVIIDRTGPVSLVGIFQRMNFPVADVPLPEDAIAPVRWYIFTLWQHSKEEIGTRFFQVTRISKPDGKLFIENRIEFGIVTEGDYQSQVGVEVLGLPVFNEGMMKIDVHLEGVENTAGAYEFLVIHVPIARGDNAKLVTAEN